MAPPITRFRAGLTEVLCLTDGQLDLGTGVFPEADPEWVAAVLPQGLKPEVNVYLLRHADGTLDLVDAGCGSVIYEGAGGRLLGLLDGLGVAPEEIDRVIFTHLHGDHAAGTLHPDGIPVFPAARLVMHAAEQAFWQGREETVGGRLLAACAEQVEVVGDGDNLGQGLQTWHLPGHTPGHMGLRFDSGLALIGDVIHCPELQLPDPDIHTRYDVDPAQGDASRRLALQTIVDDGLVFSSSHLTGAEKFLRLEVEGNGYRSIAP
ncbi:MBL fold metallo-hydrolase [Pseudodonghicola xiamenensis]|uniref:MBL fold metallo-hydrolase n=1 Tax=Pseudodonghicola xiamenensis TaxID=337702 RepID=A0A8J3H9T9_9RHOB|nr:MBL fold metallo-hydrolase [Pseudodonghicola xiamenensis]GHG94861.1 MBL fold metallo-hydrolase [Pseudodonghicola xiamenensis]